MRKAVSDLARSPDSSGMRRSARSPQSTSSRRCPRCKRPTASTVESCGHCGFSFRETRAPGKGASKAGRGADLRADASTFDKQALVGTTIDGKYRVLELLGAGGFGVVYKVEFLLLDEKKIFALKVLHPSLSADATVRKRFLREARLAMSLAHENAVLVRELGETDDGLLYFTMDYCAGESLKTVLARDRVLPASRALSLTRQILSVVNAAHEQGIVHRDLKPENIFIERDAQGRDRVKVGDFGLAKTLHTRCEDITQGGIVGSPRYMSPEQFAGGELDERTDIFSVGMILYEMLYGSIPQDAQLDDTEGLLARPDCDESRVTGAVFDVLRRALAKDVDRRFRTAAKFIEAIDRVSAGVRARVEYRPGQTFKRALLAAAALVVVVALPYHAVVRLADDREAAAGPVDPPERGPVHQALSLGRVEPLRIEDYVPLEAGRIFEYAVNAPDAGIEERVRLEIVEETDDGRFLVRMEPDAHTFYLVRDIESNSLTREFAMPNPETGELDRIESRVILRLPLASPVGWKGYRTPIDGDDVDVQVNFLSGTCTFDEMTFEDCVEVIETIPGESRKRVRYFQRGNGEVALRIFDTDTRRIVYSRVRVED